MVSVVKICNKCNIEYPATSEYFYSHSGRKDGIDITCKICRKVGEKIYYQKNKEKIIQRSNNYRKNNPKVRKERELKKIGFSLDLYNLMLEAQNNVCALCGTDKPGGVWNQWAPDHDHNTGKARGILCFSCNTTLGHIEAKCPDWMEKAKKYIEQGGFFSDNSQEIVTQS